MAVEEMTASHLLNAIGHHGRQAANVGDMVCMGYKDEFLKPRMDELEATLVTLRTELETRDPTKDEELDPHQDPGDRW